MAGRHQTRRQGALATAVRARQQDRPAAGVRDRRGVQHGNPGRAGMAEFDETPHEEPQQCLGRGRIHRGLAALNQNEPARGRRQRQHVRRRVGRGLGVREPGMDQALEAAGRKAHGDRPPAEGVDAPAPPDRARQQAPPLRCHARRWPHRAAGRRLRRTILAPGGAAPERRRGRVEDAQGRRFGAGEDGVSAEGVGPGNGVRRAGHRAAPARVMTRPADAVGGPPRAIPSRSDA